MSPIVGTRNVSPSKEAAFIPLWISTCNKSLTESSRLFRRTLATQSPYPGAFTPREIAWNVVRNLQGLPVRFFREMLLWYEDIIGNTLSVSV